MINERINERLKPIEEALKGLESLKEIGEVETEEEGRSSKAFKRRKKKKGG